MLLLNTLLTDRKLFSMIKAIRINGKYNEKLEIGKDAVCQFNSPVFLNEIDFFLHNFHWNAT